MRSFLLLAFLAPLITFAQERCATEIIDANQSTESQKIRFESWMNEKIEARKKPTFRMGIHQQQVYEIPIVVHVIHDGSIVGSGSNISKEKIEEQIAILNEDFRRQNPDASATPDIFLPVAADTEIQFVLAKQDPEGLPTEGIVRVEGSKDQYNPDTDDMLLKSESQWPPEDYMNIYVTDITGAYLGYAQYPFSNLPGIKTELENYRNTDGVVLDYKWVGANENTGSFDSKGRTATHEIGHFLGLRHIWGEGGCRVDDFCADTPVANGSNSGTSNPCSFPGRNSCTNEENDLPDMFQNYMDYSDDDCMNLFTLCQKQRMRTVLEHSPRRVSLLTSHALTAPVIVANDLGIRNIVSPMISGCSNVTIPEIEVRNYGNNTISSMEAELYLNGDLVETASYATNLAPLELTNISFNSLTIPTTRENAVEFRITKVNGQSDGKSTNDVKAVVLPSVDSQLVPYLETFDNNQSGTTYETTEYGTASKWTFTNESAYLPFYNQESNFGVKDILMSQVIDLSSLTTAELSFRYAYAPRYTGDHEVDYLDGLIVAVSTNCGQDFERADYLFESYGTSLGTTSPSEESFFPSAFEWQEKSFFLNEYLGYEHVQIAFIGVNGGGNNIFIDDIHITSPDLLAHDAGLRSVTTLPVISCASAVSPFIEVRNFGYEEIETLDITVEVNGQSQEFSFNELSMASGDIENLMVNLDENLSEGSYQITFTVQSVNGVTDEQPSNNSESYIMTINSDAESIPVKEDFENNEVNWTVTSPTGTSLFEVTTLENNHVLVGRAYQTMGSGEVSYLVSPTLHTTDYKEAAIRFKYSYAERTGYNDNLKVMLSSDCGQTFDQEVFNLNSEKLAVQNSNKEWVPNDENDWDTAFIDISEYLHWEDIRVALAFTNGNGNNIYLDDIEVITSANPDLPAFENLMVIYPNPTDQETYSGSFNITLNLFEKEDVEIRIVDMSGKVVLSKFLPESLNQTYQFETPHQGGFYLVQLLGSGGVLNQVKRLYVRH